MTPDDGQGAGDEVPEVVGRDRLTYNTYLKVPELLELQQPLSEPQHHDEMLFIVIHQAYELWFKLILHEFDQAEEHMRDGEVLQARHFISRSVEVMKLLVQQIHILETMRPVDFLHFRKHLMPASGFQSLQFREMEFRLGLKDPVYFRFFQDRPEMIETLKRREAEPDLREVFYEMLRGEGLDLPEDLRQETLEADEEARGALIEALRPIYQDPEEHLPLYLLIESLVDLDQTLALWREHHVRVVERIIGHRRGTGGSSGVGYLKKTTTKRAFPYLWEVRTILEERP